MSTKTLAILSQKARASVETTRAAVDVATQYLRRYFDEDESEIAPCEPFNRRFKINFREYTYERLCNEPADRSS